MNKQKVIEKVKKLLALSENNPSEEEAKSAALKAQKLMAEYHIEIDESLEFTNKEQIYEYHVFVGEGNNWKIPLANVISRNFRCECYMNSDEYVAFFGYDVDAQIAGDTYKFLYETGNKLSEKYKENQRETYLMGFIKGIMQALEKQSTALMIVIPKAIQDKFKEMTEGIGDIDSKLDYQNNAYIFEEGRRDGRATAESRSIEEK